jgi:hypothetical protein
MGRVGVHVWSCDGGSVRQMRWVRDYRRFGGWLALAALALQFVVSFGHVHLDALRHGGSPLAIAAADGRGSQPTPTPHRGSDADDYCAICAVIHLAANSFIPQAPQLPLPVGEARIEQRFTAVFAAPEPPRVAFRSRAPPLS